MKCYIDPCSSYLRCYPENIGSIAKLGKPCNETTVCSKGCKDESNEIIPLNCENNICASTKVCDIRAIGISCFEGWWLCTGDTICDDASKTCVSERGCQIT